MEQIKQTAVEWFMEQIGEKQPNGLYVIDTLEDVKNVFIKAKAMEKEQIENAYLTCHKEYTAYGKHWEMGMDEKETFEQYYNETYGGENER
jgi:dimeric dUTPase (all-alpha-NTP-PPase superfamily)